MKSLYDTAKVLKVPLFPILQSFRPDPSSPVNQLTAPQY